jgi:hypothetical protein
MLREIMSEERALVSGGCKDCVRSEPTKKKPEMKPLTCDEVRILPFPFPEVDPVESNNA